MKVIVAEKFRKGTYDKVNIHLCNDSEILRYAPKHYAFPEVTDVTLVGIQSFQPTTFLTVADLSIPHEYYKELIYESVQKEYDASILEDGSLPMTKHDIKDKEENTLLAWNIDEMIKHLLNTAHNFHIGQHIVVRGGTFYKIVKRHVSVGKES